MSPSLVMRSSIVRVPQMRILFFLTYAPRISSRRLWGHFFNGQKYPHSRTLLLYYLLFLKYFTTAAFCLSNHVFQQPPKKWLIPPKAPLFGALGRAITNWRNRYPLPYTTDDWWQPVLSNRNIYIYMARPRRPERGVFANANISQRDLIAWLDAQEQNPFLRIASRNETVEAFVLWHREPEVAPAQRERGFDEFTLPERIVDLYNVGERGEQGRGWGRRRTIKWRFEKELTKPLVSQMLNRIRYSVRTRHKVNFRYAYKLRNIETNEYTVYYKNINSPWFSKLSQTKAWLQEQGEKIGRPNTKWVFDSTFFVDLKVILDRQPLQIGAWSVAWLASKQKRSHLSWHLQWRSLYLPVHCCSSRSRYPG